MSSLDLVVCLPVNGLVGLRLPYRTVPTCCRHVEAWVDRHIVVRKQLYLSVVSVDAKASNNVQILAPCRIELDRPSNLLQIF